MTQANQKLTEMFKTEVSNYAKYDDGMSFTMTDELAAYKAAYYYRNSKEVKVTWAQNIDAWLVQVYD